MTIFEVLENAKYNLAAGRQGFQQEIGRQQLNNAMIQLEEGDDVWAEYEETE